MTATTNAQTMPPPRVQPHPYAEVVKLLNLGPRPKGGKAANTGTYKQSPATSAAGVIPESSRNNTLASLAGSMRRRGMTSEAIEAALQQENMARCETPLDAAEVSAIAQSIARYPAADPGDVFRTLNDTGNAERFGARYKDELRFVPERKKWFVWIDPCWREDSLGAVTERAKEVARAIYVEGSAVTDLDLRVAIAKHAKSSHQVAKINAMIDLARSLPVFVAPIASLDADDMLLGVANGVVDLRTGKLRAARREDLLTRQAPVRFDPKAKCPQFEAFLKKIFKSDKAMIAFIQRIFGYALTGVANEQCLFFFHGRGANGKSTLINVLLELLGPDYALQTPSETLMTKRNGNGSSPSSDLARLHNVRVTTANEIEDGSQLAEALVKQLTGDDVISTRFLYAEFFQFRPKFKLFIAGNHKPIIKGTDDGMWRRLHPIPFEVQIPPRDRDPKLLEKLKAELPGILNWALRGGLIWQKRGLQPPSKVTNAAKAYRAEMDVLGEWIGEVCLEADDAEWPAGSAYASYRYWAERNGFKPMTSTAFGRSLGERFVRIERSAGRFYKGIGPRTGGSA